MCHPRVESPEKIHTIRWCSAAQWMCRAPKTVVHFFRLHVRLSRTHPHSETGRRAVGVVVPVGRHHSRAHAHRRRRPRVHIEIARVPARASINVCAPGVGVGRGDRGPWQFQIAAARLHTVAAPGSIRHDALVAMQRSGARSEAQRVASAPTPSLAIASGQDRHSQGRRQGRRRGRARCWAGQSPRRTSIGRVRGGRRHDADHSRVQRRSLLLMGESLMPSAMLQNGAC